jgi:antirestriction protein ArdC
MTRPTAPARPQGPRQDLYARVTDAIVADLETGVRPWTKPWSATHLAGAVTRPLRFNDQPYSGINVLLLWSQAIARGYVAPIWLTFRQALAAGGAVRKGEKGATVVYANHIIRTEAGEGGEDVERQIGFLKAYTVFNIEQVEGLPAHLYALAGPQLDPAERIERAEAFFAAISADIRHDGDMAFYSLQEDRVQMPPFEAFDDPESYYATLARECVHWTRHPSRLDRDFGRTRFGDEGYAREELVAELGAAFLCADLRLELAPRSDHAAYLGQWLDVLKAQPRFLFTAAAQAQKACDYLHARQV